MLVRLCAGGDHGELSFFAAQDGPKGSYCKYRPRWPIFYGPHADTTVFDLCWTRQYVQRTMCIYQHHLPNASIVHTFSNSTQPNHHTLTKTHPSVVTWLKVEL